MRRAALDSPWPGERCARSPKEERDPIKVRAEAEAIPSLREWSCVSFERKKMKTHWISTVGQAVCHLCTVILFDPHHSPAREGCSQFTDKETEAQRRNRICPRSQRTGTSGLTPKPASSETHGPSYPLMGWVILVSRLPTLALEKSHLLESLKSILFVQKLFNLEYDLWLCTTCSSNFIF